MPYRDRDEHLRYFLNHLHPFLQRQRLDYKIYVVEQLANEPFNKGLLFNVGFTYAMQETMYSCIVFHDVDHIPENDYNLYDCPIQPRHMSVSVSNLGNKKHSPEYFGGSFAVTAEHFKLINGFQRDFLVTLQKVILLGCCWQVQSLLLRNYFRLVILAIRGFTGSSQENLSDSQTNFGDGVMRTMIFETDWFSIN